ncbi:MAG: carboxypeptidase-like regulatory domain-containing protein [Clostridia bacterium]|nr:carboxypeptidase-like regulatory domain-containing protein [Clostridia bacterium]
MRIIHRASLVFLLKDIYSRAPITRAEILCDGKQNPYTRKKDGHYVFSNLYPKEYTINISCVGYVPLEFKVNLRENETQVIPITMSYAVDNEAMRKITHFNIDIIHKKQPVIDQDVYLKLTNELNFMKLIEPTPAQSDTLKLNIEELIPGLIGQTYVYKTDEKETKFTVESFDGEKKCYILRDYTETELPEGGKFYAVWDLKTDSRGRITMPYMSEFMTGQAVNFECFAEESKGKVSINIAGKEQSGETLYAKINLRKVRSKTKTEG